MNPEDRQALMEQLGIKPDTMLDGAGGDTGQQGNGNRLGNQSDRRRLADASAAKLDKSLKPVDSVLIDINF
jgi:hypothetical protein